MDDSRQLGACCIVVPCYNEAVRIDGNTFLRYLTAHRRQSIVFVNDGSSDNTLTILQNLREQMPLQIEVLDKKNNEGKAEAVRDGMLHALNNAAVAYVGYWDADLATPLNAVNEMLEVFAARPEIEIVFGSRVRLLGRNIERQAVRHYLGRIFATFASVVLRLPIYDTQCGAKLFRVTPALAQVLAEPFHSRWIFDVELIARFLSAHAAEGRKTEGLIYELPLNCWVDVPGSKVRPQDFLRAVRELWFIRSKYSRGQRAKWREGMREDAVPKGALSASKR
jgi:dolichyl-phosphate beta-glucosyltransferase